MHDKLSQAVKLYDKLLTTQVSHPTWRASTSAQPAPAPYSPQYQNQTTYGQWAIPVQTSPSSPQMQAAQSTYYAGADRQPNGAATGQASVYTTPLSQVAPSEYAQYNQQSQLYGVASPPPVSVLQYQGYAPPGEAPPATPGSVPVQPSSPVQQQYQAALQPTAFAPSAQVPVVSPPSQSSLARHNTVSAYQPSQQANPHAQYLSRTKTMSHASQQLQQTAVSQQLPNFPVAPTAPPQAYQTYTSPGPVEPEREALLIDL